MNNVVLMGRLVRDPELKFASGTGTGVCKFTIAVNRMKKDDGADFIPCVAFGKTAETIANCFTKGNKILISGRIQTGSYDNKEGNKIYTTDVIVSGFDFVESKNKNTDPNEFSGNNFLDDMTPVDDGDIPF